MNAVVFDTGALIGFERNDRKVVAIVARALEHRVSLLVPATVVAQAWRNGSLQTRLARLLGSPLCDVVTLDDQRARMTGQLCGVAGKSDVVNASVAAAALEFSARVVSSDPNDIRHLSHRIDVTAI